MAFIRYMTKSNGYEYASLLDGVRDGIKVNQKYLGNLGRVIDKEAGIFQSRERGKFRYTLEMCESLTGTKIDTLHIVGGGTKNRQLCQAAADACGRRVVAGPIEATAIGNLMMQAVASGDVGGIPQAREVIRDSFEVIEYLPHNATAWQDAYSRFVNHQ